jgi:rubrerythrin
MTKFARGSRFTVLNQQLSYNEKCQKIFDNMLRALTDPDPVLSDDEDDEEALAGIGEKENQEDLEGLDALERAMAEEADADGDVDMDNNNNVSTTTPGGGGAAGRSVPGAPNLGASSNAAPGAPTVVQLETTDKHPSTYVRKIFRNPDGTVAREELIKDRETVERFLADPKYKKGRPNAKRPRMETEEEAERRQAIKREKRRVQEKNRRHRKNAEKQKELQKKFEAGGNTTDNHKNLKLRCGRCGMIGHMKTNRICPFFKSDDEGDEETDEKQAQRASRPRRAPTKKRGSRRGADDEDGEEDDEGMQLDDDSDDNAGGGGGDDESGTNPPMAKRRKLDSTRRNSPVGKLSEILLDVLRVVMVDPSFVDFKAAVKRAYAPDYYDIITNPMWLAKMREKCDQVCPASLFIDQFTLF